MYQITLEIRLGREPSRLNEHIPSVIGCVLPIGVEIEKESSAYGLAYTVRNRLPLIIPIREKKKV